MKIIFIDFQDLSCGGFGSIGLATLLRELGYDAYVIGGENIISVLSDTKKLESVLVSERPHVIGLSVMTAFADYIDEICLLVRRCLANVPIIVGGYHATIFKQKIFADNKEVDYVVIGDAEESLPRLLENISNDVATHVDGVFSRSCANIQEQILEPPPKAHSNFLDHIPFPDEKFIHPAYYSDSLMHGHSSVPLPSRYVLYSRGCPFQCSYCKIENDHGLRSKVRFYSPSRVLDNLQHLTNRYNLQGICFLDDNFTLSKEWACEVCEGIIDRKLELKWWAQIRANLADPALLRLMRRAGCVTAAITIESGNNRIRREILHKNTTRGQIRSAYRMAKSLGLKTQGTLMMGSPTETYAECLDSIAFLCDMDPDWAGVVLTTPLPGTPLHTSYKDQIKVTRYNDYDIFAQESHYGREGVRLAFHHIEPSLLLKTFHAVKDAYDYTSRMMVSDDLLANNNSKIIFSAQTDEGVFRCYLAFRKDKCSEIGTPFSSNCITPVFSPDGENVLLSEYDGQYFQLIFVDLVSGDVRQLTDSSQHNYAPVWSPDGKRIAWCCVSEMSLEHADEAEIYVSDWPEFQERRLTHNDRMDAYPVFSDDSNSIIIESGRSDSLFGLFRIDWEGREEVLVYDPAGSGNGIPHAFSGHVVFERALAPECHLYDVYVMNLESKRMQRLTAWQLHCNPTPRFSPDGTKAACYRILPDCRSELVIMFFPTAGNDYTYREVHCGATLKLPRWNRDGTLLVALDEARQALVAVDMSGTVMGIVSPPIRGQRFMEIYSYDVH